MVAMVDDGLKEKHVILRAFCYSVQERWFEEALFAYN
jgi:hypothetical protein